jgi:hypothetical protein
MSETRMSERVDATAPSEPAGGPASARATAVQASNDWWQQHDQRVYACIELWVEQWWEPQQRVLIEAVGEVFGQERHNRREAIAKTKERVLALETTSSFEERFNKLVHEVKNGFGIPQSEVLAEIERLQRQINDQKGVAALDARFRELVERVGELEKTTSLEARFAKLAHEVKRGSELPQGVLLAKIDELQRQLEDVWNLAKQPGPQGPPGPPGKLPHVKEYAAGRVHYEADVVTHAGALWQAQCDTVHSPPHDDWTLLARPGRDATTPTVCGTFDACGKYKKLDIVVSEGAAFIAKRDNPGICPGDGWQLMSRQGRQGRKGEDGARGPRGERVRRANLARRSLHGSLTANAIALVR